MRSPCEHMKEVGCAPSSIPRMLGLICVAFAFGEMEVASSDAEDGRPFSHEESEHNMENFKLCSFCASWVQSALARILTRRREVQGGFDVSLFRWTWLCLLPGMGGSPFLEFFLAGGQFLVFVHCCSVFEHFSHQGRAATIW